MFYTYNQNNSVGSFDYDESRGISHYVIIEADSADAANLKAESIGLYFDGEGDCPRCGDRWYQAYGDGDVVPSLYSEPLGEDYKFSMRWMKGFEAFVHYADGTIKGFGA